MFQPQSTNLQVPIINPSFGNASKLFAMELTEARMKYVMVHDKVANLTNGKLLLRRRVNAPNGLYDINADGSLSPANVAEHTSYPNVLTLEQAVNQATDQTRGIYVHVSPPIPSEALGMLKAMCDAIVTRSGDLILSREAAWMEQDPTVNMMFGFGLPTDTKVNPKLLAIALVEMAQYSFVYLKQEIRPKDKEPSTPLILGLDWGSCALIMPIAQRSYSYGSRL
jgi:hypothetical protein